MIRTPWYSTASSRIRVSGYDERCAPCNRCGDVPIRRPGHRSRQRLCPQPGTSCASTTTVLEPQFRLDLRTDSLAKLGVRSARRTCSTISVDRTMSNAESRKKLETLTGMRSVSGGRGRLSLIANHDHARLVQTSRGHRDSGRQQASGGRNPDRRRTEAVQLRVADQYVEQFGVPPRAPAPPAR